MLKNKNSIRMTIGSICTKQVLIVFISSFLVVQGSNVIKLDCENDYKDCSLTSDLGSQLRVQNLKCIDEECRDTFLIADDDKWYVCEHANKRTGNCAKLFKTNTLQLQSALLDLLIENSMGVSENDIYNIQEDKRALPFETLNYGRRKRYLPYETLNFGKRSESVCDCSKQAKRNLPYETMLYGKRALPFETLNYGKRSSYIPIDGYIMGKKKRQQN